MLKRITTLFPELLGRYSILFILFLWQIEANAQCAMCRAVAEDAVDKNGFGLANGLNSGILFLMGIPYVLLAVLFLVFFRRQIKGFITAFNNIHQ